MYIYAKNGMHIAIAIFPTYSAINPIKGVKTTPPTIAITRMEPPILVCSPNPLILDAKIVGYINDMKKLVKKIAHTPIHPGNKTPRPTSKILTKLYIAMSFTGCIYRMNQVAEKRPNPNATKVPVRKYPAIFSGWPV